jgi:hypothetical protein
MAFNETLTSAENSRVTSDSLGAGGPSIEPLIDAINDAVDLVKKKIDVVRDQGSAISIGDMFDLQLLMNNLAQLTEMSTSITAASHNAVLSVARNVKG